MCKIKAFIALSLAAFKRNLKMHFFQHLVFNFFTRHSIF